MKKVLLYTLLLSLINFSSWGQIDKYSTRIAQRQALCKYIAAHKIKEIDQYVVSGQDSLLIPDTALNDKFFYNKKGVLIKISEMLKRYSKAIPDGEFFETVYNLNYNYDYKNQLISESGGRVISRNAVTNYEYDSKGNIIKVIEDMHMMLMYNKEKLGGICTYIYDTKGNIAYKDSYDLDGHFLMRTQFEYNKMNELVKSISFRGEPLAATGYEKYTYDHKPSELIKVESIYNNRDSLIVQKEFRYDKNGNQTKGYEIKNGERKLVWDYRYNNKNQILESRGGPGNVLDMGNKDVRRDGWAHLFYVYDADGLLSEIKKYEVDKTTGKEILTAFEKLVYKKY